MSTASEVMTAKLTDFSNPEFLTESVRSRGDDDEDDDANSASCRFSLCAIVPSITA